MTARRRLGIAIVTAHLALSTSIVARAQTHDPIAAEVLFDEGRSLMQEGRYAEACAKFEASQRLDPGVGTLLNLGDCFERSGRTASAWARFREAASAALSAAQGDREAIARERAAALEPRLVRLVIRPVASAARIAGLTILRDGVAVEPDAWGTAVPVDPGRHVVRASAPRRRPWETEIVVEGKAPGATHTVEVPVLEAANERVAESALEDAPRPRSAVAVTLSIVSGGLGLAALGVGTWLAVDANASYGDAARQCSPAACAPGARDQALDAGVRADIATGMFIGGAIALGAGLVLFLISPKHAAAD